MVKNAHKKHIVKLSRNLICVIYRTLLELDLHSKCLGGKASLPQIPVIYVYSQNTRCTPLLHLQAIETGVAADVQHCRAGQVFWDRLRDVSPFNTRKIAEKVLRRRVYTVKIQVVEPFSQRRDLICQLLTSRRWRCRRDQIGNLLGDR